MAANGLKALHDRLLAEKPEDVTHEPCLLCAMPDGQLPDDGGAVTFSEEDLQAAIEKATAPLQARITELEASQQVSEVESAKAEIRSEMQAQLDDVQRQLDDAVLKAQAAEQTRDEMVAWLEGEAAAAAEAKELESRRDERLARISEVASFPEDYLSSNADRFARMSEEDFEVALEGWKAIGGAGAPATPLPTQTALHASREPQTPATGSAVKNLIALRRGGPINLSTL